MNRRRADIDIGDGDSVVFESRPENDAKRYLFCLGQDSVTRRFFINFDFINDNSPDPAKVNGADFHFAFESFFKAFYRDFFD